jgi:hypothetical protein
MPHRLEGHDHVASQLHSLGLLLEVESPFLGFLALMGKRIILDLYSFSCRDTIAGLGEQ